MVCGLGLLLLGATAWLPAAWFPEQSWRTALTAAGLTLPATLSPQPWLSLEAWVLLAAGILYFWWLSAWEWSRSERITLLRIVGTGVILFATVALWFYWQKSTPEFWFGPRGFGPFPNRNQTGNVLAVGGILILALALHSRRRKHRWWPVWIIGFALVLWATIENYSRAGVGLLLGGAAAWVALAGWVVGTRKWLVIGLSAAGILLSVFLLFGDQALQRFQKETIHDQGVVFGFRGRIYQDVVRMMNAGPLPGVGLGNFRPVFPYYRETSRLEVTTSHPESDWLWAGAELGWGGLALLLAAAAVWARRSMPFEPDGEGRCRAAAFIAFLAFLLHGVVDVSGHRIGSVWPALLVASLAMRRETRPQLGVLGAWGFRLGGVLLIAAGCLGLKTKEKVAPWNAATAALAAAGKLPKDTIAVSTFAEVIHADTAALQRAPLAGERYFSRAAARAGSGDWVGAIADFRIARALQPLFVQRALAEGRVWCTVQPVLALPAWEEAMERCPPERRAATYTRILEDARAFPQLRARLRQLAGSDVALLVLYLSDADPAEGREILQSILTSDPALERLDDTQKMMLFVAWLRHGDADAWERTMTATPAWQRAGWRLLAARFAERADFERASRLALAEIPRPVEPGKSNAPAPLEKLQQRVLQNTTDYAAAWQLHLRYQEAGDVTASLELLRRISAEPTAPRYFQHAFARLLADHADWPTAWTTLQKLL